MVRLTAINCYIVKPRYTIPCAFKKPSIGIFNIVKLNVVFAAISQMMEYADNTANAIVVLGCFASRKNIALLYDAIV